MRRRWKLLSVAAVVALPGASMAAASPPASARPAGFLIVNHNSLQCLYASPGPGERPVSQRVCNRDSANDRWEHLDREAWLGQVRHKATGLCLVTRGYGESRAVLSTCNPTWRDQLWMRLIPTGRRSGSTAT